MAINHLKSVLDDSSDFGETEGSDIIHDTITLPLVSPLSEIVFTDINTKTSNRVRRMARILLDFEAFSDPSAAGFQASHPTSFEISSLDLADHFTASAGYDRSAQ